MKDSRGKKRIGIGGRKIMCVIMKKTRFLKGKDY